MTTQLQPIETAPRDGRYILLAGPSGFHGTPLRFMAGRYDENCRFFPWRDHAGYAFDDDGDYAPTHWMPLPEMEGTP